MKKITIGTCVPGTHLREWGKTLVDMGYERLAINFHMDLEGMDLDELAAEARDISPISSIGFYCNALMYEDHKKTLEMFIDKAEKFGCGIVSTFAGALEGQSVEASMPKFKEVFGELTRRAEDRGVKIAIENCPMGGTWRSNTCNIGFNARAWDMMFDAVPSSALGLEWEPTHQMCQLVDPIPNLRKYVSHVVHLHGKDGRVRRDILAEEGIWGPREVVVSRFPGFGQCDWREIFEILMGAGYEGNISVEGYHDFLYNGELEMDGQRHAVNYLKWCRGMEK